KPGADVTVRVVSLGPEISLQIVHSENRQQAAPFAFEVGQEVIGTVAQQLSEGSFLVHVQGTPFEVFTPESLQQGSQLDLRVAQVEPRLTFQILDEQPGVEAAARQLLGDHSPDTVSAAQSLERLQEALAGLADTPLRGDASAKELAIGLDRLQTLIEQF